MYDSKRKCLTCDTHHLVFQDRHQGTVILGNQYTPVMVGSNGKFIPVLRIVNATFMELGNRFPYMIKSKEGAMTTQERISLLFL